MAYLFITMNLKLIKKKVTKKNVPPDITAIKILLENQGESIEEMSDEQLEKEKARLIKLLCECEGKKEK